MLATGSFDKKACIWDISSKLSGQSLNPVKVLEHNASVEDVKWYKKDENLIATGTQDKYVSM